MLKNKPKTTFLDFTLWNVNVQSVKYAFLLDSTL